MHCYFTPQSKLACHWKAVDFSHDLLEQLAYDGGEEICMSDVENCTARTELLLLSMIIKMQV
jgi:hypothetical protein